MFKNQTDTTNVSKNPLGSKKQRIKRFYTLIGKRQDIITELSASRVLYLTCKDAYTSEDRDTFIKLAKELVYKKRKIEKQIRKMIK